MFKPTKAMESAARRQAEADANWAIKEFLIVMNFLKFSEEDIKEIDPDAEYRVRINCALYSTYIKKVKSAVEYYNAGKSKKYNSCYFCFRDNEIVFVITKREENKKMCYTAREDKIVKIDLH